MPAPKAAAVALGPASSAGLLLVQLVAPAPLPLAAVPVLGRRLEDGLLSALPSACAGADSVETAAAPELFSHRNALFMTTARLKDDGGTRPADESEMEKEYHRESRDTSAGLQQDRGQLQQELTILAGLFACLPVCSGCRCV